MGFGLSCWCLRWPRSAQPKSHVPLAIDRRLGTTRTVHCQNDSLNPRSDPGQVGGIGVPSCGRSRTRPRPRGDGRNRGLVCRVESGLGDATGGTCLEAMECRRPGLKRGVVRADTDAEVPLRLFQVFRRVDGHTAVRKIRGGHGLWPRRAGAGRSAASCLGQCGRPLRPRTGDTCVTSIRYGASARRSRPSAAGDRHGTACELPLMP